jgi:hypothetical protein
MRSRSRPASLQLLAVSVAVAASLALAPAVPAADCGGAVPCQCGDRVIVDTTLTADIGPCAWPEDVDELVGLRVDSDVVLDCAGFAIRGPADSQKEEFGIRVGSATRSVDRVTVRNCEVTGFWWGIYVTDSTRVALEDNRVHHNGWKDPSENGTGYGIDVADSSEIVVRRNVIEDNGNEGLHVSHSEDVQIVDNQLAHNGLEQMYLISVEDSEIRGNVTNGGTQGLEMRSASWNDFSYNRWLGSPLQWLEDDNRDNTFLFEEFEGTLRIANGSLDNAITLSRFTTPSGTCFENRSSGTFVDRPWFASCGKALETTKPVTLDRPVHGGKLPKTATVLFPGCNADLDGDRTVGPADLAQVEAALGSVPGDTTWNPGADLDHDGAVTSADRDVVGWQEGPCPERSVPPKARIARHVEATPGQPTTARLSAEGSTGEGLLVAYTMTVVDRLSRTVVWTRTWGAVDPVTVFDERVYPPGIYQAQLTVRDAYWASSAEQRKSFKVK